ncbi:hypothetical protein RFI_17804 [Reticulomyxa filosa]|uniref:Viral A-type inclusion protein n=1 Tax=Reticulomyxa filosa TaxID=46433 RepID=X6N0M2_RETFI|nr:hypothetical protein RFI_17804 [Reticulomyxa filosa]|eukprot:ETO19428.1 hypothetical protein RFI_17804 [Reticulomyxa filosa]
MLSQKNTQYVREIESQLSYYRTQVATLVGEIENMKHACNNCTERMGEAQKDLTAARDEMTTLAGQIREMEERTGSDKDEVTRLKQEIEQLKAQMDTDKQALQWQLEHIKNERDALSESLSNERSKQMALEYDASSDLRYEKQIKELQEQLSTIEANKIDVQDQWEKRVKDNQELADKFRAKYESVKQHIKTLELQHGEYTRVNEALKKQNNEFRQMITKLQQQLKQAKVSAPMMGGMGMMPGIPNMAMASMGMNPMGQMPNMNAMANMNAQFMAQQEIAMNQMKPVPKSDANNGSQNSSVNKSNNSEGDLNQASKVQKSYMDEGDDIKPNLSKPQAQKNAPEYRQQLSGEGVPDDEIPPELQEEEVLPKSEPKKSVDNSGSVQSSQDVWTRKDKTISEKGAKKRMLVEWHFVTSDSFV